MGISRSSENGWRSDDTVVKSRLILPNLMGSATPPSSEAPCADGACTPYRMCLIGASTDSGFINRLPMGKKLGGWTVLSIFLGLPIYLLVRVPAIIKVIGSLGVSNFTVRQTLFYTVAGFFQKRFSDHFAKLFPALAEVSRITRRPVEFDNYSFPLQGFYNLSPLRTLERVAASNRDYDVIFLHLGPNDIIQVVTDEVFEKKAIEARDFVVKHCPKAGIVLINIVDFSSFLNDKTGAMRATSFCGLPLTVATVRNFYRLTSPLKRAAKKRGVDWQILLKDEIERKKRILTRVFVGHQVVNSDLNGMPPELLCIDGLHFTAGGCSWVGEGMKKEILSAAMKAAAKTAQH